MLEGNASLGSRAGVTVVAPRDGLKSSFVVRRRIGGALLATPGSSKQFPSKLKPPVDLLPERRN